MSRNIKKSNQYITDCLNNCLNQYSQGDERRLEPLNKTIELDNSDQDVVKEAKLLGKRNLFSQYKSACFFYNDEYYFIYVGAEETNYDQDAKNGLNEEEITPGWTVLVISELEVKIKSSVQPLEIYNELAVSNRDPDYYKREDCEKIRKYFEDWYIYKINSGSILLQDLDISRISLAYFLKYNSVNNLSFEQNTIDNFSRIAYEGNPSIPFENILDSYISFSWKYSFLDIYQCLEKLFMIPNTLDLYNKLYKNISSDQSFVKFMTEVESSLGWKPNEETAFKNLFKVIKHKLSNFPNTQNEFNLVKNKIISDYSKNTTDTRAIYSLRNNIVHCRSKNVELEVSDWDSIISFCLLFTYLIYAEYGEHLRNDSDT